VSPLPEPVPFDAPVVERGVGFFETVLLVERRAVLWEAHLARFFATLGRFELPAPRRLDVDAQASSALDVAAGTSGVVERALRLSYIAVGKDLDRPESWRLDLSVRPIPEHTLRRREGSKVVTLPKELCRDTPGVKSTSYFASMAGLRLALRKGADEALFQSPEGSLLEGTSTGLVIWNSGRLKMAGKSMLPSVTTSLFLHGRGTSAPVNAVDVQQGALLLGSLTKAAPVASLDGVACAQPTAMLEEIRSFNARLSADPGLGQAL
jgi:4-amino-4-deoxychorismate lyase